MTTVVSVVLILLVPVLLVAEVEGAHDIEAGSSEDDFNWGVLTRGVEFSSRQYDHGARILDTATTYGARSRKLLKEALDIPQLKTTQGQNKKMRQGFATVSPAAASEGQSRAGEAKRELVDLSGMDYSPAAKKTPIHN